MPDSVTASLLKRAWAQLWKPGSPYFLPTAFVSGASGAGSPVPALSVPDVGPFGLFGGMATGEVSLGFNHATLSGFDSATAGTFSFDEGSGNFTARIEFIGLSYGGSYSVTGNADPGCAMAGGSSLMNFSPHAQVMGESASRQSAAAQAGEREDASSPSEEERLELARKYRDKLTRTPAGLSMVGSYYDNNWAMNEIVRGDNAFTSYLSEHRARSSEMADQTAVSAEAPADGSKTIGDEEYSMDSLMRQVIFLKMCRNRTTKAGDAFAEAAEATTNFTSVVIQEHDNEPTTVGAVMEKVSTAPPINLRSVRRQAMPGEELVGEIPVSSFKNPSMLETHRRAVARAEAYIAEYTAKGKPNLTFTERAATGDLAIGSGVFRSNLTAPVLVITGAVETSGPAANPTLTLLIERLTAIVHPVRISLGHETPWAQDKLFDKTQQTLASAQFIHDLVVRRLSDWLSGPQMANYLNQRLSDAVNQALGPF